MVRLQLREKVPRFPNGGRVEPLGEPCIAGLEQRPTGIASADLPEERREAHRHRQPGESRVLAIRDLERLAQEGLRSLAIFCGSEQQQLGFEPQDIGPLMIPLPLMLVPFMSQINTSPVIACRQMISAFPSILTSPTP